jgi:hypothetical protein
VGRRRTVPINIGDLNALNPAVNAPTSRADVRELPAFFTDVGSGVGVRSPQAGRQAGKVMCADDGGRLQFKLIVDAHMWHVAACL